MPLRGVLQTRWLKGLNAAFGLFSQPPNSLPRLSNLILTRLGALQTTPGSRIVSSYGGLTPQGWNIESGMWKEIFYYNPSANPERAGYYGLREEPGYPKLAGAPGQAQGSVVAVAGAVAFPGTQFAVTAADGVGGESILNPPTAVLNTGPNQGIQITFFHVPKAYGYNIYVYEPAIPEWFRLVPFGATNFSVTVPNDTTTPPPATVTYTLGNFTGVTPPTTLPPNVTAVQVGTVAPPALDTTQTCNLVKIPVDGRGWNYFSDLIAVFPADFLPNPGGGGSGQRGGGPVPSGGGGPSGTVSGGISGVISPIPQIIQFADLMFLALGNGITPYYSIGQSGPSNTVPISNTFQATIPAWQASIGYIVGDQVVPTAANLTLFTAIQGGISGAGPPAWPVNAADPTAALDRTVADGQVIWKNSGPVATSPPPQGAAHVEVYAGSLWVANTRPSFNHQNPSDGPSAVWMSDANNPNSWNPLNTAQVARDDGTEIMGIKAFSIAEAGIPTTQQLVVFKNFTTYVINGVFGAADFSIQQAETDQGCIAPRTIQFVPGFGLMRLTHLGFSYFDGIRDRLVSTDLHPYLFGDSNQPDITPMDWAFAYFAKGAQVGDPPMYVCACPVLGAYGGSWPIDLLGSIPPSQFQFFVSAALAGGPTSTYFPPGQYYFRVSLRGPVEETAVTPSIGPITVPSLGTGPAQVTIRSFAPLPAVSTVTGYTGWRVYWGSNGPGSETFYQDTGPELYTPNGPATILIYPGAATTGPPIGISGTLTRIFCYDLTLKCWTVIDLPFAISVLKQFRIMGQPPVTISGGFWDATVRRLFSNAPDWDGVPIDWTLQTGEVYNQGGDQRVFYRRLRIRGSGNGPITITPNRDGFDDEKLPAIFWALGGDQFMAEGAIMAEGVNCHATVAGQGQVLINSLNFHAVPNPTGAGVVIS